MTSKRKSTVPCMIPAKSKHLREEIVLGCLPELLPTIPEDSILSISSQVEEEIQRTYNLSERGMHRCPPCSFQTMDLNLFLKHMDCCHMDFHTQPVFYCLSCKIVLARFEGLVLHNAKVHPKLQVEGSTNKASLLVTKRDGVLTVEQILYTENEDFSETGISVTKMPIMKMMVKGEHKKIVVSHTVEVQRADDFPNKPMAIATGGAGWSIPTSDFLSGRVSLPVPKIQNTATPVIQNMKSLWNSASSSPDLNSNLPKVMIPLSSIPTYDPAMDLSSFLKTSFGKFPYPTKAELCYLTVVSGFPEEQIKLWFTAQRLKQGISWSPEEIEDTRRRMFNTVFQAAPIALQTHSHQQVPQHYVSSQPSSVCKAFIPHAAKGSEIESKGRDIVTQTGITHRSYLKQQSSQSPKHGIITKEPGRELSSKKAENSLLSQVSITINHIHDEKTGSISSGKTVVTASTSNNQKQNISCCESSIMNLTNIVRKIDCNVNNINCTGILNRSPSFIYGQDNSVIDTKESSNNATSRKYNNEGIYKSTSHSTICTKKEGSISDHTSSAKNTDSSISSSTVADELFQAQTSSVLEPFLNKSKNNLPEELEALKQSVSSSMQEQKHIASKGKPMWVDKPYYRDSSADSHLALGLFHGNMPQPFLCSNACFEEDHFSFKSLLDQPEKHYPKSLLGAPQVPYSGFTAICYKDHKPLALQDHPQLSKAVLDRVRFTNKIIQMDTDDKYLKKQKSQTNSTFFNNDKDEHHRVVHLLHALQKDKGKMIAAVEEVPSLQQYTNKDQDQWVGNNSYLETKTESIKIHSKPLNKAKHMHENSRKHIKNQQLDEVGGSNDSGALKNQKHIPDKEQFVEDDKGIKEKSQEQNDQAGDFETEQVRTECLTLEQQSMFHKVESQIPVLSKKNLEGIKKTSEHSTAKDQWLKKDEEPQLDIQSRECLRGELLKV